MPAVVSAATVEAPFWGWVTPNRHVQLALTVLAAIALVVLSGVMMLRVPRVRDAVSDVWPFRLWLKPQKKAARKRPPSCFTDSSSESDDEGPLANPASLSGLARIVLLGPQTQPPPRAQATVQEVEEEPEPPPATFSSKGKREKLTSGSG
jgi:hypothetical protein